MATREAASRINPGNSLTDQAKVVAVEAAAEVEEVSRNSRAGRINPDRSLRIARAVDKSVIVTDKAAGFGFPKPAAFFL